MRYAVLSSAMSLWFPNSTIHCPAPTTIFREVVWECVPLVGSWLQLLAESEELFAFERRRNQFEIFRPELKFIGRLAEQIERALHLLARLRSGLIESLQAGGAHQARMILQIVGNLSRLIKALRKRINQLCKDRDLIASTRFLIELFFPERRKQRPTSDGKEDSSDGMCVLFPYISLVANKSPSYESKKVFNQVVT